MTQNAALPINQDLINDLMSAPTAHEIKQQTKKQPSVHLKRAKQEQAKVQPVTPAAPAESPTNIPSAKRNEKSSDTSPTKGILQFLKVKTPQKIESSRWQRIYEVFDDGIQHRQFSPEKRSFREFLTLKEPARRLEGLNPAEARSAVMRNALIEAGVDASSASLSRRSVICFFDTPAYYKVKSGDLDEYSRQKFRNLEFDTRENGICSYYLPGRAFYGLAPFQAINFIDPLKIYDEVEYEAPTPMFADSGSETSSSDSESSEEEQSEAETVTQLKGLNEEELYLKLAGKNKIEADDLGAKDGYEEKGRSVNQKKRLYEFLSQKQDKFDYPVPQMCPEGLKGQKGVLYCFQNSVVQQEREDVQIVKAEIPNRLKPLFVNVGEHGSDLRRCFDDQDFIVEFEKDDVDD